jgi:GT2 family glycosyltransferase
MKQTDFRISVIVISFNGIEFIDNCLSTTIMSLANTSSEVIVIDNASSDGTVELIKNKYSQVRLLENKGNLGFARAVNQGFELAAGKYILILNQDTRIIGNAIPALADRLEREQTVGTIGPEFIGFDGRLQKSARAFPRYRDLLFEFTGLSYLFSGSRVFANWKMGWFDHLAEREVDQPMGAALMIRRELLEKIGGLDESFGIFFNDVDFCRRVREAGYVNLYYPEAVVAHFVGGSTRKRRAKMIIESHRSMLRYFAKYARSPGSRVPLYFWGGVLYAAAAVRAVFSLILRK